MVIFAADDRSMTGRGAATGMLRATEAEQRVDTLVPGAGLEPALTLP
jgi:hypothetical protein